MEKNYLSDQDYEKMMRSWYVKRYVNPRFPFWREDSERLKSEIEDKEKFVIKDSVPYWIVGSPYEKKHLRPVPEEVAYFAFFLGKDINIEKFREVEAEHNRKAIEDYRRHHANREYTLEEIYEMKSAFGEGATIVDVFTGRTITL